MSNEELEAVKKQLAAMKKIELTGFTNTETATAYFQEKEKILEGIVKTLETVTVQGATEVEALKSTVKSLREELKGRASSPKELTRRELCYSLGKGIAAAWAGNHKALGELSFTPNLKADNWTNPREVSWGEKGFTIAEKAALGSPMGNLATNDQYLINPVYETEIMSDAAKKSVMMNLVRHRPMMGPSIFLPTRDRGGVQLHWLTDSKLPGVSLWGPSGWSSRRIRWRDIFRDTMSLRRMCSSTLGLCSLTSLWNPTDRNLIANVCWLTKIRLPGLWWRMGLLP